MKRRKSKKLPHIPPWEEILQLLRATTRERDRLLLMLAAYLGLRVAEICRLDAADMDFCRGFLFIRQGKGNKDAVLPIPKFLLGPLRGWLAGRLTGPVFPSRQGGGPLTTRAVRYLVKRVAAAAGLPDPLQARKYYPHVLRHAFCTERIRRGVPLPHVQRLMRHEQVQTTIRYTHVVPDDLREGIDR